jgi:hypothetical protein
MVGSFIFTARPLGRNSVGGGAGLFNATRAVLLRHNLRDFCHRGLLPLLAVLHTLHLLSIAVFYYFI